MTPLVKSPSIICSIKFGPFFFTKQRYWKALYRKRVCFYIFEKNGENILVINDPKQEKLGKGGEAAEAVIKILRNT